MDNRQFTPPFTQSPYDKQGGVFDDRTAWAVRAASAQLQTSFDGQMAKAALEASDMRAAYDKLTCENVDQKKAAQVCAFLCTDRTARPGDQTFCLRKSQC